jgi:transcriptional regulator with XRE-family HTH domain
MQARIQIEERVVARGRRGREPRLTSNNVKRYREEEGLSQPQLANFAGVSTRTLTRTERGHDIAPRTRHRVVNGFNRNPQKLRDYTYNDLYPNELLNDS